MYGLDVPPNLLPSGLRTREVAGRDEAQTSRLLTFAWSRTAIQRTKVVHSAARQRDSFLLLFIHQETPEDHFTIIVILVCNFVFELQTLPTRADLCQSQPIPHV